QSGAPSDAGRATTPGPLQDLEPRKLAGRAGRVFATLGSLFLLQEAVVVLSDGEAVDDAVAFQDVGPRELAGRAGHAFATLGSLLLLQKAVVVLSDGEAVDDAVALQDVRSFEVAAVEPVAIPENVLPLVLVEAVAKFPIAREIVEPTTAIAGEGHGEEMPTGRLHVEVASCIAVCGEEQRFAATNAALDALEKRLAKRPVRLPCVHRVAERRSPAWGGEPEEDRDDEEER